MLQAKICSLTAPQKELLLEKVRTRLQGLMFDALTLFEVPWSPDVSDVVQLHQLQGHDRY